MTAPYRRLRQVDRVPMTLAISKKYSSQSGRLNEAAKLQSPYLIEYTNLILYDITDRLPRQFESDRGVKWILNAGISKKLQKVL